MRAWLDEDRAGGIRAGRQALVLFPAFAGTPAFQGRVVRVAPEAPTGGRTGRRLVEIDVALRPAAQAPPNPTGTFKLLPGMPAEVRLGGRARGLAERLARRLPEPLARRAVRLLGAD